MDKYYYCPECGDDYGEEEVELNEEGVAVCPSCAAELEVEEEYDEELAEMEGEMDLDEDWDEDWEEEL